jgi:hypothetical protein
MGRAQGIAFVGAMLGEVLLAIGHPDARGVLEQARAASLKLGATAHAKQLEALLARAR